MKDFLTAVWAWITRLWGLFFPKRNGGAGQHPCKRSKDLNIQIGGNEGKSKKGFRISYHTKCEDIVPKEAQADPSRS